MGYSPPVNPIIAIIGATGTGKSQLAVDLATRFDGEIINGDAMQLYDGLPIITNKITPEEMKGIPHHLLGCVKLEEEPWTMRDYTRKALQAIHDIRSRGRLPILVGGTHYYTQSLLFRDTQSSPTPLENEEVNTKGLTRDELTRRYPILDAPTEQIWTRLNEVDPVIASRWHPNDRRRIQTSLKIYLQTGRKASDIYQEQRNKCSNKEHTRDNHSVKGQYRTEDDMVEMQMGFKDARFPTLILWMNMSSELLESRLDGRVHEMVRNGLLSEVQALDDYLRDREVRGYSVDKTSGICVSIGFKEFQSFCATLKLGTATEQELERMKLDAIASTQAATRKYAKRQVRWIRNKLMHALKSAGIMHQFFLLNGTEVRHWDRDIVRPATDLVQRFLAGTELPSPDSLSPTAAALLLPKREYDLSDRSDLWVRRTCDVCSAMVIGEDEWTRHVKGRPHKKMLKRISREEKRKCMEEPAVLPSE